MKSCHICPHFLFLSMSSIKIGLFHVVFMGSELSFAFSKLKVLQGTVIAQPQIICSPLCYLLMEIRSYPYFPCAHIWSANIFIPPRIWILVVLLLLSWISGANKIQLKVSKSNKRYQCSKRPLLELNFCLFKIHWETLTELWGNVICGLITET